MPSTKDPSAIIDMNELLPSALRAKLPNLSEQEGSDDPIVYAKFFFPASCWTWFVTEGEPAGEDFMFFGYVIGFENGMGILHIERGSKKLTSKAS